MPPLKQFLVEGALAITESRTETETETRSESDVFSDSTTSVTSKAVEEHQQETLLVPSGPTDILSEPATNLHAEECGPATPY